MKVNKPRILFCDIEISPVIATTWDLYPKALSINNILKDWYLISAAWKWAGEKTVHAVSAAKPHDDKMAVKALRDVVAKADIVVGHNLDKFDLKKLNSRIITHNLAPLPQVSTVDTLKEVKRVATFTSHKLDYLSKVLNGKRKIHVDYELWLQVLAGSKKALAKMVTYNKVDVIRTEELYNRLLPYMKNHPHVGVMLGKDRRLSCNKCGSTDIKRNGIRITAAGMKKQEIQCMHCFSYSRIPLINISL
jgi:DNA polymerase elongation subunit (family B)